MSQTQTSRLRSPSEVDIAALTKAVRQRDRNTVIMLLFDEAPVIKWPMYFDGATDEDKEFLDECRVEWERRMGCEEEQY